MACYFARLFYRKKEIILISYNRIFMLPNRVLKNKYKLMVFIVGLYLVVDVWQHQGQARLLFPISFPAYDADINLHKKNGELVNKNKQWKKAVNTIDKLNALPETQSGFECDVYFYSGKNSFEVHHDWGNSSGLDLESLLLQYQKQKLTASIWLDFKNLNDSNAVPSLKYLIQLKDRFNLQKKILVESSRADLLGSFADSGFFTSYYTPMFNPYRINEEETKQWADSLAKVIGKTKVSALSGYYFQYPFLKNYFPKYPVLIWSENSRFSLVNWLFKKKIAADEAVLISLNP